MNSNIFVDEVPEDFECPICMSIVKDPVEHSTCQRLFCKKCLDQIRGSNCPMCRKSLTNKKTKMHRIVRSTYEALRIRCEYEGCAEIFRLEGKVRHDAECGFRPAHCVYCDVMVAVNQLEIHHREICTMYPMPCTVEGCNEIVPRSDMDNHYRDFGKRHVELLNAKIDRVEKSMNRKLEESQARKTSLRMRINPWGVEGGALLSSEVKASPSLGAPFDSVSSSSSSSKRIDREESTEGISQTKRARHMTFNRLSHHNTLLGHEGNIMALIISECDNRLFSGSMDSTIQVWDTVLNTSIATLEGHDGGVWCIALSPQRHRLFSGSTDETIKVWDAQTWQCLHTLEGHTGVVSSLTLDESTNRLYSASSDNNIKLWDLHTATCIRTLPGHNRRVSCLCLSTSSNRLYSGSWDETIRVWDTVSYDCVETMDGSIGSVFSLCLSEDGTRLYSGSSKKNIRIWETATNTCIAMMRGHTNWVTSLCLSSNVNRLISGSFDKTIKVWDTTSNTCIDTVDAHIGRILQ